jgi:hypothetical protein
MYSILEFERQMKYIVGHKKPDKVLFQTDRSEAFNPNSLLSESDKFAVDETTNLV